MNSWHKYARSATAHLEYLGSKAIQIRRQCYPDCNCTNQINISLNADENELFINPHLICSAYSRSCSYSDRQFLFPRNNKLGASETNKKNSEFNEFLKNEAFMHINFTDLKIVIGAFRNISYLKQDF